MIGEVQSKSTLAVTAMAAGDSQVMEGAVVVEEVGRNFKTIIASVGVLADQIKGLSQAADQVSDGVQNMAAADGRHGRGGRGHRTPCQNLC